MQAVEEVGPAIRMLAFDEPSIGAMIKDALDDIAVETDDSINRAERVSIAFADEDAVPLHRHGFGFLP